MREQKAQELLKELGENLSLFTTDDVSVPYIIDFNNGACIGHEEINVWECEYNKIYEKCETFFEECGYDYGEYADFDKLLIKDREIIEYLKKGYIGWNKATIIDFEVYCCIQAEKIARE